MSSSYRDIFMYFYLTMMEVVLHDRALWRDDLLPLSYTRPVGNLRIGALTLDEKWRHIFGTQVHFYTEPYLQEKFPAPQLDAANSYLVIRANLIPDAAFIASLKQLAVGSMLMQGDHWLAYHTGSWEEAPDLSLLKSETYTKALDALTYPEDIFLLNATQIKFDYDLLVADKLSAALSPTNTLLGDKLFLGARVFAECCTFNTLEGPIYIDDDAIIEEGSNLRGPIAIGKHARVKMGSKLYPNVTVGPGSTIAGEVNNAVLWGNASKGHDGYLGCSVLGEGCNIGGGSANSNMQNNWKAVSLYNYSKHAYRNTGKLKIGLFMGDYAMCGINSSITTGCVIGVGAQLAISTIIPKFVPDFLWQTDSKKEAYQWPKFEKMMEQRALLRKEACAETTLKILWQVFVKANHGNEKNIK